MNFSWPIWNWQGIEKTLVIIWGVILPLVGLWVYDRTH